MLKTESQKTASLLPLPESKNYFDDLTQASITKFQNESDIEKRKEIFVTEIRPAFEKLIENIIFVYKFHSLGSLDLLKADAISFLFENLYKFDGSRGSKAFSYFNVIAKNYFIQKVKVYKKKNKSDVPFDQTMLNNLEQERSDLVYSYEEESIKKEFLILLKEEIKTWRNKFDKVQEKKVLEAVIILLENPDVISIQNKKGIYLYLREITGLCTKQIVTNLGKLRRKYKRFCCSYWDGKI
jgi:hypothetical protein